MIVDRTYQNIVFPLEKLNECNMPAVRIKHDFDIILSWAEIVETINKSLITNELIMNLEREKYNLNHNNAVHYQAKRIQVNKIKKTPRYLKALLAGFIFKHSVYENIDHLLYKMYGGKVFAPMEASLSIFGSKKL